MMKQGLCIVAAACMGALLFSACARQTVWETIGDDCCGAPEATGYEIAVELPDDAVEEVFSDRGSKRLYAEPGGGMAGLSGSLRGMPARTRAGACTARR